MKKAFTVILTSILILIVLFGVTGMAELKSENPAVTAQEEEIPTLPTDEDGVERVPEEIDIWTMRLFDADGNEYEDVTAEKDKEAGRRRMQLVVNGEIEDRILISEEGRYITHIAVATLKRTFKTGD